VKIYVAGPYSAETLSEREANVERALAVGLQLIARGHDPYIPHLTHYLDVFAKRYDMHISPEWYYRYDFHWMTICDALYFIGSSPGADREREIMESLHRPIYTSLDEVPKVRFGE